MGRHHHVGAVRHKLARMLSAELARMGIDHVLFDGSDLLPVTGYWKSQDVFRWESVGLQQIVAETGRKMSLQISSWEAMTSIVRQGGVFIEPAYRGVFGQYEAFGTRAVEKPMTEAELLRDANSNYSSVQLAEIEEQSR